MDDGGGFGFGAPELGFGAFDFQLGVEPPPPPALFNFGIPPANNPPPIPPPIPPPPDGFAFPVTGPDLSTVVVFLRPIPP